MLSTSQVRNLDYEAILSQLLPNPVLLTKGVTGELTNLVGAKTIRNYPTNPP